MKKFTSLVLLLVLTITVSANKKPKIEGNKNVALTIKEIEAEFTSVEINDGLEVIISQGHTNGYSLNADSNLHESIKFMVVGDVLKVFTSERITSSKKLEIDLSVINLQNLILKNGAKVSGKGRISTNKFSILAHDNSKFDLDVETDDMKIDLRQNAGGKLVALAKSMEVTLSGRTDMKASLNSNDVLINMNDSSDFSVEGDAEFANIKLNKSAKLNARNLRVKNAELFTANSSDVYVNASKSIGVIAKGKSNIYVYGKPAVDVNQFNDKAKIIKR